MYLWLSEAVGAHSASKPRLEKEVLFAVPPVWLMADALRFWEPMRPAELDFEWASGSGSLRLRLWLLG